MTAYEKHVIFCGGKIFVLGQFKKGEGQEVVQEMVVATFERNNSFFQTI